MPRAETAPRWLGPALIVVLAALGGLAGILAGRAWLTPGAPGLGAGIASEGMLAPALQLNDLQGQPQQLASLTGEPLLINFWATWCAPCVKELPLLQALHRDRGDAGLRVLTVAQEDDAAAVKAFLLDHEIDLPAWIDPPSQGDASRQFGNVLSVLPYSILIDAEGRIVSRKAGAFSEAELDRWAQRVRQPHSG